MEPQRVAQLEIGLTEQLVVVLVRHTGVVIGERIEALAIRYEGEPAQLVTARVREGRRKGRSQRNAGAGRILHEPAIWTDDRGPEDGVVSAGIAAPRDATDVEGVREHSVRQRPGQINAIQLAAVPVGGRQQDVAVVELPSPGQGGFVVSIRAIDQGVFSVDLKTIQVPAGDEVHNPGHGV